MISSLKRHVPWWAKIGAKLVLRRLSQSQGFWRHFGVFQHGFMLDPAYALGVIRDHYDMAQSYLPADGFTLLEMGPGDSLATALLARGFGAERSLLMDVHAAASVDLAAYQTMARELATQVPMPERMAGAEFGSVEGMLSSMHCEYHTGGLADWAKVQAGSVDWIFSQAVLEHVWLADFRATLAEGARVLKPGAVATHCVDMGDHLGDSLHSLRISQQVWESGLFRKSGFYTNRLRSTELVAAFEESGYDVVHWSPVQWDSVPLRREVLRPEFRHHSDEVLRTHSIYITARRKA